MPALIFGVAFGNVLQGVPFRFDDDLRAFYDGSLFGLLNPFALLCGLCRVAMLVMHGAALADAQGERGPVAERAPPLGAASPRSLAILLFAARRACRRLGRPRLPASPASSITAGPSNPLLQDGAVAAPGAWLDNLRRHPWMLVAPAARLPRRAAARSARHRAAATTAGVRSLSGSAVSASSRPPALSMFPFILPSSPTRTPA